MGSLPSFYPIGMLKYAWWIGSMMNEPSFGEHLNGRVLLVSLQPPRSKLLYAETPNYYPGIVSKYPAAVLAT